jgi:hypothetical protein
MIGAKKEVQRLTRDNESLRRLLGKALAELVNKTKENQKLREQYENQMQ